jgi:hypothetical protein
MSATDRGVAAGALQEMQMSTVAGMKRFKTVQSMGILVDEKCNVTETFE